MTRRLLISLCVTACAMAGGRPQRIVSLSPDLTEILYGVGAFDRVVGISNYDEYPPATSKLPRLGQLHSPNLEQLMALHPDLVVINNSQAAFVADSLKQLGLPVLETSNQSVQEVYAAIMSIGRATGNAEQAAKLVATTRERITAISDKTAGLAKPKVVIIVDRTPGTLRDMYTATDGSYLAELVEAAGGQMGLPRVARGYRKLDKEELLALDPEVILDLVPGPKSRYFKGNPLEAWAELPELRAYKTQRIYGVDQDFVPHASQRIVDTAELFASLIHPGKH